MEKRSWFGQDLLPPLGQFARTQPCNTHVLVGSPRAANQRAANVHTDVTERPPLGLDSVILNLGQQRAVEIDHVPVPGHHELQRTESRFAALCGGDAERVETRVDA